MRTVTPTSEALSPKFVQTQLTRERQVSEHTLKTAEIEQLVTVYNNLDFVKKEMKSSSSQTPPVETEKND